MASIIACSLNEPKKNQRRGTMIECARKKKINYYGVKKVDKKIVDMLTGKSNEKLYTLSEARGKAMGMMTRANKLHDWIKQFKNQENKKDKVKKWTEELEEIKVSYRKMAQIVKKLTEEDKKLNEEMQKIKAAKEKEAEDKKKRIEERKKKAEDKKKKNSKKKSKK